MFVILLPTLLSLLTYKFVQQKAEGNSASSWVRQLETRINPQGEVVVWDLLLLGIRVSPWEHSLSEWIHRRLFVLCLGSYLTFLHMWQILSRDGLFLQSRSWENHSVPSSYFDFVFSTLVEMTRKTCGFSFWLCHKLVLNLEPVPMPLGLETLSHQS